MRFGGLNCLLKHVYTLLGSFGYTFSPNPHPLDRLLYKVNSFNGWNAPQAIWFILGNRYSEDYTIWGLGFRGVEIQ